MVAEWVELAGVEQRPPDHVQVDKGHGRIERRELWVVAADDMGRYLEEEFGWPAVKWMGQIRRYRRRLHQTEWESVTTTLWLAGGTHLPHLSPAQIQARLRTHWVIENGVFHVRDVTQDEDRLHGRAIAFPLSTLRNAAINLIRQAGFHYIPDARRLLPSRPDFGLSWLFDHPSLENCQALGKGPGLSRQK